MLNSLCLINFLLSTQCELLIIICNAMFLQDVGAHGCSQIVFFKFQCPEMKFQTSTLLIFSATFCTTRSLLLQVCFSSVKKLSNIVCLIEGLILHSSSPIRLFLTKFPYLVINCLYFRMHRSLFQCCFGFLCHMFRYLLKHFPDS